MEKHHWSQEEVRQYRQGRRSLVSYNPQDANLWVKKERGICAWTLNWGNPKGVLLCLAAAAGAVLLAMALR